ncbi:MAG TPA: type II toxin-antitoxin system RelE/ParE family toxin [Chitinophagaceae bacterium]|nr:type II toxin-antitoxin system RelE/ParE family toxin [Chitinophagaceae bacterium]
MKIEIRKSFTKDADKLPVPYRQHLTGIIDAMEKAGQPSQLADCKKLTGYKTAYRIRMGQYRLDFYYENKTIELLRILHRKEIYRYFP